jgi:hypothetical protein
MKRIVLAFCGVVAVLGALGPVTSEAQVFRPVYCSNLVPDPGFELGVSDFYAQGVSPTDPGPSRVLQTAVNPIEGAHSLGLESRLDGQNFWWIHPHTEPISTFIVSARLRSVCSVTKPWAKCLSSSSDMMFCAMAYYGDGGSPGYAESCTLVQGTLGDKGIVVATLSSELMNLDPNRELESVRIRLYQVGQQDVTFAMDRALACIDPWEIPNVPLEAGRMR